jgi:hypothetical protein
MVIGEAARSGKFSVVGRRVLVRATLGRVDALFEIGIEGSEL